MMETEELICRTCKRTKQWHDENNPVHAFNNGLPDRKSKPTTDIKVVQGGDPVLRLALIEAGVITYEHLAIAEEKLKNARTSGEPVIAQTHTANGSETSNS